MKQDEAWGRFREWLRSATAEGWTPRDLAAQLYDYSDEDVRNWLRGKSTPALADLPRISMALGVEPMELAVRMGILRPAGTVDEVVGLARSVLQLENQRRELVARTATVEGSRAALVVHEAVRTGRWAVAVYRALEGPEGYEIQVADRLTFRRTDGAAATHEGLIADLGDVLKAVGAVRLTEDTPQWRTEEERKKKSTVGPAELYYSIALLTAPFPAQGPIVLHKLESIGIISSTVLAWAADIGAHLATALGWSYVNTRAIANAVNGIEEGPEAYIHRADVARSLLLRPATQEVWSHFDRRPLPRDPVEEAISEGLPPRLLVVRLRESDALLHAAAKKEATAREQKSLERALAEKRTRMDDIWNTHCREPQCLELKVENVELEGQAERNAKFLRSLRLADRVLNHIGEYFGLEVSKLRHSGFVRWRNAHGLT